MVIFDYVFYQRPETCMVHIYGSSRAPPWVRLTPWWSGGVTSRSWTLGLQHGLFTGVPPATYALHCAGGGSAQPAREASRAGLLSWYTYPNTSVRHHNNFFLSLYLSHPHFPLFFLIPLYAQPSLIPTFTFLYCPYPNSFDPPGSSAVDFQFWRGRFHCCDSWINGLFRLCGPPANGAGCWLLQHPSGGTLEVKGWHTGIKK